MHLKIDAQIHWEIRIFFGQKRVFQQPAKEPTRKLRGLPARKIGSVGSDPLLEINQNVAWPDTFGRADDAAPGG
jgi:hypothetical protein